MSAPFKVISRKLTTVDTARDPSLSFPSSVLVPLSRACCASQGSRPSFQWCSQQWWFNKHRCGWSWSSSPTGIGRLFFSHSYRNIEFWIILFFKITWCWQNFGQQYLKPRSNQRETTSDFGALGMNSQCSSSAHGSQRQFLRLCAFKAFHRFHLALSCHPQWCCWWGWRPTSLCSQWSPWWRSQWHKRRQSSWTLDMVDSTADRG